MTTFSSTEGRTPVLPDPAGMPLAIRTLDLAKRYRTMTALDGLTMSVATGEVFGFLGPNGAGKTTAVKLLLGLSRPTGGEGWMLGAPLGDRAARRRVGYLPELFRYQDWLTAREVLGLHCSLARVPRDRWRDEIARALRVVSLEDRGDDRVGAFSKGMQQRLGLGVALLGRPDLVVLDEPTSALDPLGRYDVRAIIQDLKRQGTTVFLNSHLLTEVEHVCDRVAVIDRGRVLAQGAVRDLVTETHSVRLRVTGLHSAAEQELFLSGVITQADGWYTISGILPDRIPDLVAGVVRLGGRVHAVEPGHQTLEQRFLQLLRENHDAAGADHRVADLA